MNTEQPDPLLDTIIATFHKRYGAANYKDLDIAAYSLIVDLVECFRLNDYVLTKPMPLNRTAKEPELTARKKSNKQYAPRCPE